MNLVSNSSLLEADRADALRIQGVLEVLKRLSNRDEVINLLTDIEGDSDDEVESNRTQDIN